MKRALPGIRPAPRRGVALIGALVALSVVSVVLVATGWHFAANRRLAERRQHQLQAAWLARAGVELAAGRLLTDPGEYTEESVELLPRSRVRLTVRREPGAPNSFRVVSEARYPADAPTAVVRSLTRLVRRKAGGAGVRLEVAVAGE